LKIDEDLVRRARQGDRLAMETIWRECHGEVYRYAWWNSGSREDAEDITSEAFYRAFRNLDRYDPAKASFETWIMRITRNLVIDARRREARHPRGEMPKEATAEGEVGEGLEADEERQALREAMGELTEEQRQVLVMKYVMDMKNRDIGTVLGRREGAVNALHHRALRKLGRILEERGAGQAGTPEGDREHGHREDSGSGRKERER